MNMRNTSLDTFFAFVFVPLLALWGAAGVLDWVGCSVNIFFILVYKSSIWGIHFFYFHF